MPGFFVQPQDIAQGEVTLRGQDAYHIARSLRMAVGDTVTVSDGAGRRLLCRLTVIRDDRVTADIVDTLAGSGELPGDILLCQALPKRDKLELIVQKATELGVSRIGVFSSRFCAAYMNENKLDRLQRVAREAAKQCLRARAPEIVYYDNLNAALASCKGFENKLFACEFAKESEADISALKGGCALVIGSEGGFSEEEFAEAKAEGFAGVTLGKRILRAETAAIAFTSVVMFALGELR